MDITMINNSSKTNADDGDAITGGRFVEIQLAHNFAGASVWPP